MSQEVAVPIPIRGEHPLPDPLEWRDRANCRGMDPAIFFSDLYDRSNQAVARATCAGCEVRSECLEYAIDNEREGFWGGVGERERLKIRRDRRKAAGLSNRLALPPAPINHGTEGGYQTHRRRGEDPCRACIEAASAATQARAERRGAAS